MESTAGQEVARGIDYIMHPKPGQSLSAVVDPSTSCRGGNKRRALLAKDIGLDCLASPVSMFNYEESFDTDLLSINLSAATFIFSSFCAQSST